MNVQPLLTGLNSLVFNGVPVTLSPQGKVDIVIAGVRTNATQIPIVSRAKSPANSRPRPPLD